MKYYLRKLSTVIRKPSRPDDLSEDEEHIPLSNPSRIMTVIACRSKQRLCQQAWNRWTTACAIVHDYTSDVRIILSRFIPDNVKRTELEVSVIYKWIVQNHLVDPTGLAFTVMSCTKRSLIINAIQHCRYEKYNPGEVVLLQGEMPKSEEGQYTILAGTCEIAQFPKEYKQSLFAHQNMKQDKEALKRFLENAKPLHVGRSPSGFGELSTLVRLKRTACVRAAKHDTVPLEVIVIPQEILLELLDAKHLENEASNSLSSTSMIEYKDSILSPMESLGFFRLSGLAYGVSPGHILSAAQHMRRRVYNRGKVLYIKGEPVDRVFIVMSGEILLDTSDPVRDASGEYVPFLHTREESCYKLSTSSILGDEALAGYNKFYASTAVVISPMALVFEFTDYGIEFLAKGTGLERYAALAYKDRPPFEGPLKAVQDEVLLHKLFDSLSQCISEREMYRGMTFLPVQRIVPEEEKPAPVSSSKGKRVTLVDNRAKQSKMIESRRRASTVSDARHFENRHGKASVSSTASVMKKIGRGKIDLAQVPRTLSLMAEHHALSLYRNMKTKEKLRLREVAKTMKMEERKEMRPIEEDVQQENRLKNALIRNRVRNGQIELSESSEADISGGVDVVASFFCAMMEEVDVLEEKLDHQKSLEECSDDSFDDYDMIREDGEKKKRQYFPKSRKTVKAIMYHFPTQLERYLLNCVKPYMEMLADEDGELSPKTVHMLDIYGTFSSSSLSLGTDMNVIETSGSEFQRITTQRSRRVMERSLRHVVHMVNKYRSKRIRRKKSTSDMSSRPDKELVRAFSLPPLRERSINELEDSDVDTMVSAADMSVDSQVPEEPVAMMSEEKALPDCNASTLPSIKATKSMESVLSESSDCLQTKSSKKLSFAAPPLDATDIAKFASTESSIFTDDQPLSDRSTASTSSELSQTDKKKETSSEPPSRSLSRRSSTIEETQVRERKIKLGMKVMMSTSLNTLTSSAAAGGQLQKSSHTKDSNSDEILSRFQEMMRENNPSSKYQEGKRKAAYNSRFKLSVSEAEHPPMLTRDHINHSSTGDSVSMSTQSQLTASTALHGGTIRPLFEDQFHKELYDWTLFIKSQTDEYRKSGHVSIPVLGKESTHAAQWGNKVIVDKATSHGEVDHQHLHRVAKNLKNKTRTTML